MTKAGSSSGDSHPRRRENVQHANQGHGLPRPPASRETWPRARRLSRRSRPLVSRDSSRVKLRGPATPVADPVLHLLAGPNGAGKSTLYERVIAETHLPFVNA